MTTKKLYHAYFEGQLVAKRRTDRTYTHCVITAYPDGRRYLVGWCGRLDLAFKSRNGFSHRTDCVAHIVDAVEQIKPSNKRTAAALNDSGVFAPFTVRGED